VRLEELDFELPPEAIAQRPAEPRDSCRLMHLASSGLVKHAAFFDLPRLLRPGDTLVFNDSKVLPARILSQKPSGGAVELLFLQEVGPRDDGAGERWEALVRPSRRLRVGSVVVVAGTERLILSEELGEGRWIVSGAEGQSLVALMEVHGQLPLPPYIARYPEEPSEYQTVYAAVLGSAAAPTAGLHFTHRLLRRLEAEGIDSAYVTLHVGLDTFLPIRESVVEEHRIHSECYSVSSGTLEKLRTTRARGGRVIAVGTTVTRVLETLGQTGALAASPLEKGAGGSTAIFITPGYQFLAVDGLLTNFHLPRSTVLSLAMAFAGVERIRHAYREAIVHGYRFFSFGDAMLIDVVGAEPAGGDDAGA
jgi:S-adenosylmethionine:tRNA ribosyltransferase-isomerase